MFAGAIRRHAPLPADGYDCRLRAISGPGCRLPRRGEWADARHEHAVRGQRHHAGVARRGPHRGDAGRRAEPQLARGREGHRRRQRRGSAAAGGEPGRPRGDRAALRASRSERSPGDASRVCRPRPDRHLHLYPLPAAGLLSVDGQEPGSHPAAGRRGRHRQPPVAAGRDPRPRLRHFGRAPCLRRIRPEERQPLRSLDTCDGDARAGRGSRAVLRRDRARGRRAGHAHPLDGRRRTRRPNHAIIPVEFLAPGRALRRGQAWRRAQRPAFAKAPADKRQ